MNYEIVKRFAENDIEIPFAQRVVTIKNPEDFMPKPVRKPRTKPKT
jgi:small-conductance mechanosensitive channel